MPFVDLEGKLVNTTNITHIEKNSVPASQTKVKCYVWLVGNIPLKLISLTVEQVHQRIQAVEASMKI